MPGVELFHEKGDKYVVTGVDRKGKRFKITTANPYHALGINVWRGSLWQIKAGPPGKRKLIRRTWN